LEKPVDRGVKGMLKDESPYPKGALKVKALPSFEPIPAGKIGLFKDEYRQKVPAKDE